MIGGNGSVNFNGDNRNDDNGNPRSFSFSLSPTVGYFPMKNFAFGLSLPFDVSWSKASFNTSPPTKSTGNGYSISTRLLFVIIFPLRSFSSSRKQPTAGRIQKMNSKQLKQVLELSRLAMSSPLRASIITLSAGPAFFLSPYTSIEILANYQSRIGMQHRTNLISHITNRPGTLALASRSTSLQTKNNF